MRERFIKILVQIIEIVFLIFFVWLFLWFKKKYPNQNGILLLDFGIVLILSLILLLISNTIPDKGIWRWVKFSIELPFGLLFLIAPVLIMISEVIISILILTVPGSILIIMLDAFGYHLSLILRAYITLTLACMSASLFFNNITSFITRILGRGKGKEAVETQIEFTKGVVNNERIRYVIYAFYFILLTVTSTNSFLNKPFMDESLGKAILYSFSTYLAFERLVTHKKLFFFDLKNLLLKLIKVYQSSIIMKRNEEQEVKAKNTETNEV